MMLIKPLSVGLLLLSHTASANWFSKDTPTDYANWESGRLYQYLKDSGITVPTTWSKDQLVDLVKHNYDQAAYNTGLKQRQSFLGSIKQGAIDSWDESSLRQFLREQGVLAPNSKKEELHDMALSQYAALQASASSLSVLLQASATSAYSGATSVATDSANSAYSNVASGASSVYTAAASSASSALSAAASAATGTARWAWAEASGQLYDARDYVYSTWSDVELRKYLEKKGVIKSKQEATRDELLAYMKDSYSSATDPVYNSWSDSYMKNWMVRNGLIKSDSQKTRDELVKTLKTEYYDTKSSVYSTWSDSDLKKWLIANDVIKSDAQYKRDELLGYMDSSYTSAKNTVLSSWSESDMRTWLIDNGYLKSDAKAKKDEILKSFEDNYSGLKNSSYDYLKWSDARLRAYLRSIDIPEEQIPKNRNELLGLVRQNWLGTVEKVEYYLNQIRDSLVYGKNAAHDSVHEALQYLAHGSKNAADWVGKPEDASVTSTLGYWASRSAASVASSASKSAASAASSASSAAAETSKSAHHEL